ncbi:hypothetical protein quinque_011222 [Culex quinquefasciatus]
MGHINFVKLKLLLNILFVAILVNGHGSQQEAQPEFLAPLDNLTVTQGRDVSFTCVVNNLGQYRVAWIKSDSKAILAIHTHMVAVNPRLSVTHNGHNTWKLHISHVQLNDSGSYMCQVNTDPMRHQSGNLDVVVSPDILNSNDPNSASLEEGVANEGGNVQLLCQAVGVPLPTVQWRREGSKDIIVRSEGREKQAVKVVEGERLVLNQVQRTDMGGYLCIASNGVPPSVSKRYDVQINFSPSVKAGNQLVGAPVESHVMLQCIVEAFPTPLNGWYKHDVPPAIVESMTSNDMVVREGTNVSLTCKAKGFPEPYVMWRREDGDEMAIGGENVNVVDGEMLYITKVSRLHMAAYLCVASNGVPPSISKRVQLRVQFPPMLSIPNQLEGAYVGQDVILECHTEAYPASINYWTTERGDMIISDTSRTGDKFETMSQNTGYTKYMQLKIRSVGPADFGSYRCVAKNSLGETDGLIKLDGNNNTF